MNPYLKAPPSLQRGLTLIELLIVVSLVAVVLGLAAPSFTRFIQMQRLKSINAQLVTDLQLARSEAVGRNTPVGVRFSESATMSCYVLYTTTPDMTPPVCDCLTSTCDSGATEIRTTRVPADSAVKVSARTPLNSSDSFSLDPRTGGMVVGLFDGSPVVPDEYKIDVSLDTERRLRDKVGPTGRVSVCTPSGSTMVEPPCPP